MSSKITIKRSTTAIPPAGLSFGEMAFVQGTGLTANQLYVGISGGSPVWVGAQIGTTGSWTDNSAKTSLATQYAIDQRISAQISGSNPITTVDDNTNATRYIVFSSGAGVGVTLGVDVAAGPLSYNPSTSQLTTSGDLNVNGGDIFTTQSTATVFNATVTNLSIGSAATGITMGATTGNFGIRNPSLTVGSSGITGTIYADDANLVLTTKNYSGAGVGGDSSPQIVITDNIGSGFVNIEGGDLRLGNKTLSSTVSGVDIVFEGTTDNTNELKLTAGDPAADYTLTLPHLTDTLVGKATSDTFTNKTYDTAGSGNVFRIAGVTLSAVTGTGSVVLATSPTLVTPTLGVASATTINKVTLTAPATGSTITVADGKTLTASNTLTFTGTDSSSVAFGTGGTVLYTSNLGTGVATFLATPSSANLASALTDETGTGGAVFANSPTLVTPNLGTPSTLVGTNITGTATSFTASNVTTNANLTGAITSVGNATSLGTSSFSSANLLSALTDKTGTGLNVFGTNPTITTSLVSGSTGFALLNTTATTVNFAGAATTLTIGVVGGTAAFAGAVTVAGDLIVNGTTTTINSTTLTVDDKNIEMGSVASPTNLTADGGGITIKGDTDKSIIWDNANNNFTSSENWNLPTGKVFKINNVSVLSSAALGSGITGSSLTQVGTITSGTWQGTQITDTYLAQITTASKVANSATTATSANTVSAIVARDASGDFSARIITGSTFSGNALTATTATTATNIVATEQTSGTIFLVGVAAASASTGLLVNATPATALTYDVTSGELSATLIDGGSF
jgi:hypothetical protein